MQNLIGQSIGRYHIIEKFGEGGMAVVYKAYDTHLECEVAVKVIRTDMLAPVVLERALKRFEHEAKAVAKLNHPNIVRISDYGEYEGIPYLVMPLMAGGTIKSYLKERGRLPWQEAVKLVIPIAEALGYAHEHEVIHRDIKPSNILLTEKGQPMLTDFGVAKIVSDEATQDLTGTSATVGTPEYMAPEQITSKTVDGRADIYGLGVVLYEMITGRRPYEADTFYAVMLKQANDPLPEASKFVKDLPREVEYILFKALAKKPQDRFQTMAEFSEALRNLSVSSRKVVTPEKVVKEEKLPVKPKRRAWLFIPGAIALVAIIALLISTSVKGNGLSSLFATRTPTITPTLTRTPTATVPPSPTPTKTPIFTATPLATATQTPIPITMLWIVNGSYSKVSVYLDHGFIFELNPGESKYTQQWQGFHVIQMCVLGKYNTMSCDSSDSFTLTTPTFTYNYYR